MAEKGIAIADQTGGTKVATRDAREQTSGAESRVIQLVDFATRPLTLQSLRSVSAVDGALFGSGLSWTEASWVMPSAGDGMRSTIYNGYLYTAGDTGDMVVHKINLSNPLGGFVTSELPSLPTGSGTNYASCRLGDLWFLVSSTGKCISINLSSPTAWTLLPSLPASLYAASENLFAYNGYLYCFLDTTGYRLSLTSPTAWINADVTDIYGSTFSEYNGTAYMTHGSLFDLLYSLPLSAPTGAWSSATATGIGISASGAVCVVGSRFYRIGGSDNGTPSASIVSVDLENISAGTTVENSLPVATLGAQAIESDNKIYLVGGFAPSNTNKVYIGAPPAPVLFNSIITVGDKNRVVLSGICSATITSVTITPVLLDDGVIVGTLPSKTVSPSLLVANNQKSLPALAWDVYGAHSVAFHVTELGGSGTVDISAGMI